MSSIWIDEGQPGPGDQGRRRHREASRVAGSLTPGSVLWMLAGTLVLATSNLFASELVFAMAAWGGGATAEVSVHNPHSDPVIVTLSYYLQDGTLAQRESLNVGSGMTSVVRRSDPAGSLQPGWIHVFAPAAVLSREMFDLSVSGKKLPVVGVLPAAPSRRITLFGYRASGLDTGIAVVNPNSSASATAKVRARTANGSLIQGPPIVLPPNGARSLYISELFPGLGVSFEGVVEVESQKPIAALTLLQDAAANITTVGALAWEEGQAIVGSCESIQEAIDALPPAGGRVLIPAGRYPCKTAVVVNRDNVWLTGEGAASQLELQFGANSPLLVLGDTATPPATRRGIRVTHLSLNGRRALQSMECWGGPCDSGGLTFIRNNGVTIRKCEDTLLEKITVRGCRSGGVVTEKGCRRLTLRDIEAYENEFDGIAGYETTDSVFEGLFSHDNPWAGLSFDLGFSRNAVTNATITGNGKVGVFMRQSKDNVFHSLQISKCEEHGIFLAQPPESPAGAATGNTFIGCQIHDCKQAGVRVNDTSCVNNQFVGCQLSGNPGGCISEASPGLAQQSGVICR